MRVELVGKRLIDAIGATLDGFFGKSKPFAHLESQGMQLGDQISRRENAFQRQVFKEKNVQNNQMEDMPVLTMKETGLESTLPPSWAIASSSVLGLKALRMIEGKKLCCAISFSLT